jgi:hypothetical protein
LIIWLWLVVAAAEVEDQVRLVVAAQVVSELELVYL